MTEIEWIIYQDWHNFLLQTFGDQLAFHGFLYLRAPPEVTESNYFVVFQAFSLLITALYESLVFFHNDVSPV